MHVLVEYIFEGLARTFVFAREPQTSLILNLATFDCCN